MALPMLRYDADTTLFIDAMPLRCFHLSR